ncbi:hypothetical protein SprV_0301292600 [Sparganum proliferum]
MKYELYALTFLLRKVKIRSARSKRSRSRTSSRSPSKRRSGRGRKVGSRKALRTKRKLLELNKAAAQYKIKTEEYDNLLQRVVQWFSLHLDEVWKLICAIHSTDVEVVTHDTFKAVLADFKAPFTSVELHLITMLLDPDSDGCIQMKDLEAGVLRLCQKEELSIMQRAPSALIRPPVLWVRIFFRYLTYAQCSTLNLHFSKDVPANTSTGVLVEIIRQHCRLNSPSVNLFSHKAALPKDAVPIGVTLEELGILGGQRLAPEEFTLYYQPSAVFGLRAPPHTAASLTFSPLVWLDEFAERPAAPTSGSGEAKQEKQATASDDAAASAADPKQRSGPARDGEDDENEALAESLAEFLSVERTASRRIKNRARLAALFEQTWATQEPSSGRSVASSHN